MLIVIKALDFSAQKHRKQRRKDSEGSPYINHPIALMRVIAEEAGLTDPNLLAVAALHDTIEDTATTLEELEQVFGPEIANMVFELSDNKSLPKAERKKRQIDYASKISQGGAIVLLADKICNLRDLAQVPPVDWSLQRKRDFFDWAKQVVDNLPSSNEKLETLFEDAYALRP
ncbi:MAG: HD domain-containing protein [Pseudomonadota bacterium]